MTDAAPPSAAPPRRRRRWPFMLGAVLSWLAALYGMSYHAMVASFSVSNPDERWSVHAGWATVAILVLLALGAGLLVAGLRRGRAR